MYVRTCTRVYVKLYLAQLPVAWLLGQPRDFVILTGRGVVIPVVIHLSSTHGARAHSPDIKRLFYQAAQTGSRNAHAARASGGLFDCRS